MFDMDNRYYEHLGIVDLKTKFPDINRDFIILSKEIRKIWKRFDDDNREWLFREAYKAALPSMKRIPDHKTRMYITTDFFIPVFVAGNLDQIVYDNLVLYGVVNDTMQQRKENGESTIILWKFDGEKLVKDMAITPWQLCQIMIALSPENLLSFDRLRPNWSASLKNPI